MRKFAYLRTPAVFDGDPVVKIMLYTDGEEAYLFEYGSATAMQCDRDRCYDSLATLYEDWNALIDDRGWIDLADPLPDCQHDAFLPIRVKGRDTGKPQWGSYELLQNGIWTDFTPEE